MANRRIVVLVVVVLVIAGLVALVASRRPAPPPAAAGERPALAVELVQPHAEMWADDLFADGEILPWQEAVIGAETTGLRITAVLAETGDVVHRGQELALLDDRIARAELAQQEAALAQAQAEFDRAAADQRRSTAVDGTLSDQEVQRYRIAERSATAAMALAEARLVGARLRLGQTRILAPDDGILSARKAVLGAIAQPSSELFRLLRQGRVEWAAQVIAQDLPRLAPSQRAEVVLPGGATVAGTVRLVSPVVDSRTRTAVAMVALEPGSTRPGTFVSGRIAIGQPKPVLVLPETAVVHRDGRDGVMVVMTDRRVVLQRIVTGRQRNGLVEIRSGATADVQVVARGAGFLGDGDLVAISASTGPEARPPVTTP